jgi:DNA-binding TFAR19-related protein (PDSD5 family)
MAELVARERKLQETKERNEKAIAEREKLLKRFLEPDALTYLEGLKTKEPVIGKRIQEILLYLIVYRGLRQMITQIDIRYVERQIKGEGPTIKVQRDGETSDFGAYVREAIKANEDDTESDQTSA